MLAEVEAELTSTVDRLRPSVVRIERGPPEGRDEATHGGASGSGFLLADGLVVTNDHVVRGTPKVRVTFFDGASETGTLLGEDPLTDLALLQVPHGRGRPAPLADSGRIRVGQFALAVGNALGLPGAPTVSLGVVSALGRPLPGTDFVFEGLIQTDAAVNPGNSGGPLATIGGEVMGVNSAVIPFAQGVGFAVPSNTVREVARQIRESGRVVRPWLGVSALPLPGPAEHEGEEEHDRGILVAQVVRGGPAASAGLKPGDVLLRVGGEPVRSLRDLLRELARLPIGAAVDVRYGRDGELRQSVVRIQEAPATPAAPTRGAGRPGPRRSP